MCTGPESNSGPMPDYCDEDEGGPLVCKLAEAPEDTYMLFGVISEFNTCAKSFLPGLYTYVVPYLSWIRNNMVRLEIQT